MTKFKVDQRVVLVAASDLDEWNEYEDTTTRGSVQSINEEGILVKWDDSWRNPNPSKHTADELITEVEANKILSKLEKEFEAWAGPIRKKIEKAAKYLAEAGELATAQNKNLYEMDDICGPLLSAMNTIGWSTSSLSC